MLFSSTQVGWKLCATTDDSQTVTYVTVWNFRYETDFTQLVKLQDSEKWIFVRVFAVLAESFTCIVAGTCICWCIEVVAQRDQGDGGNLSLSHVGYPNKITILNKL